MIGFWIVRSSWAFLLVLLCISAYVYVYTQEHSRLI